MSNPMLNEARWGELSQIEGRSARSTTMTVNGAVEKTIILLVLLCAALGCMWWAFWGLKAQPNMQMVMPLTIGGGIAGSAVGIAKILFFIFLVLFVVSLIFGRRKL